MKDVFISPGSTLKQALRALSQSGGKCLVVTDEKRELLGTLTDGDLRKAILKGKKLSDSIASIYQTQPIFFVEGVNKKEEAKRIFLEQKFDMIPVVNQEGRVSDVLSWSKVFNNGERPSRRQMEAPVVIMAGGKGTRMEPFTKVLPKPLIPINEKPVIEHIIQRFTGVGVREFVLTLNYKARIMKAYFEELQPEYTIDFVEEMEPLGTASSLKSLEGRFQRPFFVTNCDIIVKADYPDIYEFHLKGDYDITLVASMKNYTIPYGTCELNGEGHLHRIHEKPEYDFLVNTGLYVVNPEVLRLIPEGLQYHITHLIEDAKGLGGQVGVFPIDDDAWIDVGQWAEYQKAVDLL